MSHWVADPGPPTLAETIDNVHAVLMEAAKATAAALERCQMTVEPKAEERARSEYSACKATGDHWRRMLNYYAARERFHPELRDKPVGTKCRHDGKCWMGADLFVEPSEQVAWSPPPPLPPPAPPEPDSRLPPERDVGADDT